MMKTLICFFDGACEPKNPHGNMGTGCCVFATDKPEYSRQDEIFKRSEFFPAEYGTSNNVAEYMAMENVLSWLLQNHNPALYSNTVQIWGDSKLVICQLQGLWRAKGGFYMPVYIRCKEKLQKLRDRKINVVLNWHKRERNFYADELSKQELVKNNVQFRIQPLSINSSL